MEAETFQGKSTYNAPPPLDPRYSGAANIGAGCVGELTVGIGPFGPFGPWHELKQQSDQKLTNPKDAIGSTKLPLHLVPDSLSCFAALAFLEGALKYGQFNWRVAGVRASIYLSAMERHMRKWKAGEDSDPKTGVPHLASILACAAIILDADVCGKLNDDRPPAVPTLPITIDVLGKKVADLKELFKDENPVQYTRQNS